MSREPTGEEIREIIYLIRRLIQAGYLYNKELDKQYHVSAPQLHCLIALREKGPLPPSQIAKAIMVKSSTVTGIIDRLEYKGLVRRNRNSPDRRVIHIELTEQGTELAQNAPPPIQQKILDGLKELPQEEVARIIGSMKRLTEMLDVDLDPEELDPGQSSSFPDHAI
ncbi:MAG: MarR family transcriptional regulator [Deltaproteobacteria bacterium]|nr:MarR family transcriptional regulator [Deltaproteobacteria bacterium]